MQNTKNFCLSFNFFNGFDSITDFEELSIEFQEKVVDFSNKINSQELITENTIIFERDREDFYKNLMSSINKLKDINAKLKDLIGLKIDLDKIEKDTLSVLCLKIQKIQDKINEKALKETLSQDDCDKFRIFYLHLEMFSKYVCPFVIDVKKTLEIAESKIHEKVDKINIEIMQSLKDPQTFAENLARIDFLADNFYFLQSNIKKRIDDILNIYKRETGPVGIRMLSMQLEKVKNGLRIMSEYSILAGED